MKKYSRRDLLVSATAFAIAAGMPVSGVCAEFLSPTLANLSSEEINALFVRCALERRMPETLGRWLSDRTVQTIDPYRVFDNVWYVGIRWVSAYAICTSEGVILIDTLHEPFVDRLLENLTTVGISPDDIRYVLMTHGHFDHVGGYARLKPILKNARFAMSARGWKEAKENTHHSKHNPFTVPTIDMTVKDGDLVTLGDTQVQVLETPGHTWGTVSYVYPIKDGQQTHRAVTVGGQGLNAMDDVRQLDAYIRSMQRLANPDLKIDVDLTAHPFSTGLTEKIPEIVAHRHGQKHPLVNRLEYVARLESMVRSAQEYRTKLITS